MRKRDAIVPLTEHALRLAQIGDFEGAAQIFAQAIELDAHDLDLKYNLAIVEERLGHITQAAALLMGVVQRKSKDFAPAASRLSRLLTRYRLDDNSVLTPAGLCAALQSHDVALQPFADAGFQWLMSENTDWRNGIDSIATGTMSEIEAGRALMAKLKHADRATAEMLNLCLRKGIVKNAETERLLTGVRGALLFSRATEFSDRNILDIALALMIQGWNNDHAWAETPVETAALDTVRIDRNVLLSGDLDATQSFVRAALYRPLDELLTPPLTVNDVRALKPRSVRDALSAKIEERTHCEAAALTVPTIGTLCDAISQKVAHQYEKAPYPRWRTVQRGAPGALLKYLRRLMPDHDLSALESECEVLIAGCGTGQQALMNAIAHGPNARVLAIDLSRASLGYAAMMAEREKIANLTFVQADILDAKLLSRQFDVIYCVGVLHHMADWRAGWRVLLDCLKPDGLMNVGLYSAVARQGLSDLRAEPDYPGPGCTDAAARAYRRSLLLRRDDGKAAGYLKKSRDFYSLNTFRDLVLHESEATVTIEEISEFLESAALAFRGFTLNRNILSQFAEAFPSSQPPGTLADWAAFEKMHPHTFDGMYDFWIDRKESSAAKSLGAQQTQNRL